MMSDGALSQDEIDALLGGGGGSPAPAATAAAASFDTDALERFFSSTAPSLSSNLATLTGASVSLDGGQASASSRDAFLEQLPDNVTVINANYTSGFPGEHLFVIPENTAKAIAALMTKEEDIQLDEMAMSVLGEVVSQMVGTQITALTDKTGNKSIASSSPTAANVPKATAALPAGNFALISYELDLGDGNFQNIWEILGPSVATDIANSLNAALAGASAPKQAAPAAGAGMGMAPSMQPVQYPNMVYPRLGPHEAGNIGLIMDVSMELTVELGRTRKLIKEILGMGEGTIIELDKLAGEPVDILVNHKLIARGEVVVIDENFGVRVTEIVSPMERFNRMDS
jgi:flagellar motor switch protein FliN/FliY